MHLRRGDTADQKEGRRMIHNEAEAICARLSTLDGVQRVTRGWPASFARLPCIAVSKAADMPVAFADDGERIAQLEYYIRIFTSGAQQADMLAEAADAAMEEMGYARTFSYDSDEKDVRMAALRYRKYV